MIDEPIIKKFRIDGGCYFCHILAWDKKYHFNRAFLKPASVEFGQGYDHETDQPVPFKIGVFHVPIEKALYSSKDSFGIEKFWFLNNPGNPEYATWRQVTKAMQTASVAVTGFNPRKVDPLHTDLNARTIICTSRKGTATASHNQAALRNHYEQ